MISENLIRDKIQQSFLESLKKDDKTQELLLGLSGGLDSSVLLHLLAEMQSKLNFKLKAIHIHHGLSPYADDWLDFCKKKCKSLDIDIYTEKVKVNKRSSLGIEGEARELRYQAIKKKQKDFVVLGHHQNDQAETFMLQLLRGSGLKGLAAIPEFDAKRNFWRPLLHIKKNLLESFAKENNIEYIEDESNQDERYDRNFIRQKVLPLIESRYPSTIETITRSVINIAEGYHLNESVALDDSKNVISDDKTFLLIKNLKNLSKLRAINLIRWWLSLNNLLMPSRKNIEELFRQVKNIKSDTSLNLKISDNFSIRASNNKLFIVEINNQSSNYDLIWSGQEEIELPNKSRLHFLKTKNGGLSLSKIGVKTLHIKSREGGEKLKLFSDQPSRSLKYLFQKADIPHWERDQIPLIFANKQLVVVPNLGIQLEYQANNGEEGYQINWLRD